MNSGRLSVPCNYAGVSPLNSEDSTGFEGGLRPGYCASDAPVEIDGKPAWLLNQLGNDFRLLVDARVDEAGASALAVELTKALSEHEDLALVLVGPAPAALGSLPRTTVVTDVQGWWPSATT